MQTVSLAPEEALVELQEHLFSDMDDYPPIKILSRHITRLDNILCNSRNPAKHHAGSQIYFFNPSVRSSGAIEAVITRNPEASLKAFTSSTKTEKACKSPRQIFRVESMNKSVMS